ncbi:MAG: hypothetical protein M3M95_05260 [Pseudomonadota bacterium]|nr:hypothetical protein [Pseudomonadota bacterium]
MLFTAVLGAALLLAQPQPGRAPPVDPDPNAVEGVVVEGRRESEAERRKAESNFVREHAAPTRRGRLARWDQGICPGVIGLSEKHGVFLTERIATEARALGLSVGAAGCRPDILILMTSRPDTAAREFRAKYGPFLAHLDRREDLESGGGGQKLEDFLNTSRPVRWWHVAKLEAADGRPLGGMRIGPDPTVVIPVITGTSSSRLGSLLREDLSRAVIIVDTNQLKGVTYEALGSYLSMVALAQLNPEAEPGGVPSILSLFKDRDAGVAPPETLTAWDRAYLKGLYEAPANTRNLHAQRGAIRRSLSQVGAAN